MPLSFITDENVDFRITKKLREAGYTVLSIFEEHRGVSDRTILEMARETGSILITEDSDFGEWIFAHKEKNSGVVFLRYHYSELNEIIDSVLIVLKKYQNELYTKFIVITQKKIRVREI